MSELAARWHVEEPPTEVGVYINVYGDGSWDLTRIDGKMLDGTYNSWRDRFEAAYGPIPDRPVRAS